MIFRLVFASLVARALTVGMTILAIALSVALFLGVEKIRTGAKASFADTISGTDLIVGARSGSRAKFRHRCRRLPSSSHQWLRRSALGAPGNADVARLVERSSGARAIEWGSSDRVGLERSGGARPSY